MSKMFPYQDKYAVSEEVYKTMKIYSSKLEWQVCAKIVPSCKLGTFFFLSNCYVENIKNKGY